MWILFLLSLPASLAQRLPPAVLERDRLDGQPGHRAKLSQRVANGNDGKRLRIVWQPQDGIHFFLKQQVPSAERGAQADLGGSVRTWGSATSRSLRNPATPNG